MSWPYDWDSHPGVAVVTVSGSIARVGLSELRDDILAQPRLAGCDGYVVDFGAGDASGLTAGDMRSLAAEIRPSGQARVRRALVVSDAQAHGLAAVYRGHVQGRDALASIGVFLAVDDAIDWFEGRAGQAASG